MPPKDTHSPLSPALILAGPTGVGKTELALRLARRFPFELISADSMQVYRGMAIGTAQPSAEELAGVPIHCCGVIEPGEPFSVKRFLELGEVAHRAVTARGAIPLYVGGTGLYLRSLRWGLFEEPSPIRAGLRNELEVEAERVGWPAMHARLAAVDPEAADRIPLADSMRIVRALEVIESGGRPLTDLQTQWLSPTPRFPHTLVILDCPRPLLIQRIERRVDAMLEGGWIEETRALLASGCTPDSHCFKALGYREIAAHLAGEGSLEDLRATIKAKTRQFSKRQMTWFRKEAGAHWIPYDGSDPAAAATAVQNLLERHQILT